MGRNGHEAEMGSGRTGMGPGSEGSSRNEQFISFKLHAGRVPASVCAPTEAETALPVRIWQEQWHCLRESEETVARAGQAGNQLRWQIRPSPAGGKSAEVAAAAPAWPGHREVSGGGSSPSRWEVGGCSGPSLDVEKSAAVTAAAQPEGSQHRRRWLRPAPAGGKSAEQVGALARPEESQRRQRRRRWWRGQTEFLWRSHGGFHVMVKEAVLCGFSGFASPAAPCHKKEELSAARWRLEPVAPWLASLQWVAAMETAECQRGSCLPSYFGRVSNTLDNQTSFL
uniref:uncharacterized protein LOC100895811 n=1 Tax=Callithrix jacchus TaxID=9483 RepID=UPI0023DD4742|nr:uncharacterized protein LOC100895811 [Callithrix jacchus]